MSAEIKRCAACSRREGRDVWKSVDEFGVFAQSSDGRQHSCKVCAREMRRQQEQRAAERRRISRMDIPFRPDRLFRGKPGRVMQRVAVEGSGW